MEDLYYYYQLSETNRIAYREVYEGIKNHAKEIYISSVEDGALRLVYRSVMYDSPQFYYVAVHQYKSFRRGEKQYMEPVYTCTVEQCKVLDEQIQSRAKRLIQKASLHGASESEIYRRVHDVLAAEVTYGDDTWIGASDLATRNYTHTILGVFLHRKGVCDAISKTYKYLLNMVGCHCLVAVGDLYDIATDSKGGHAWNIIRIGNQYYHVDVTNDVPAAWNTAKRYNYYCLSDEQNARDHSVKDFKYPACTAVEENYFVKNGLDMASASSVERYIAQFNEVPTRIVLRFGYDADVKKVVEDVIHQMVKISTVPNSRIRAQYSYDRNQRVLDIALNP